MVMPHIEQVTALVTFAKVEHNNFKVLELLALPLEHLMLVIEQEAKVRVLNKVMGINFKRFYLSLKDVLIKVVSTESKSFNLVDCFVKTC